LLQKHICINLHTALNVDFFSIGLRVRFIEQYPNSVLIRNVPQHACL
jgi:hypothetical protein